MLHDFFITAFFAASCGRSSSVVGECRRGGTMVRWGRSLRVGLAAAVLELIGLERAMVLL